MNTTSKRAATTSVSYTYSDEDGLEADVDKRSGKKKKLKRPKTVVCKICRKKYTDNEGLKRHMELHTDILAYSCDICDTRFKTSKYLARHRKRVHSPATHECEDCGKRFTLARKLDQHRLVHTGEKPHKCEVCGKAFRAPFSLKTHRLIHTNEKPYKCQYCPYACRDNSTLRKHHERHTGTLKWHECAYCNKKYYSKAMLKNHVAERHFAVDLKVIPCPHCDTKFRTNGKLNTHIKVVHERAMRATCEVCGLELASKYNMASHLRSHLRVRPYKCKFKGCQMRFKDMYSLKKHGVTHTPSLQHACGVCGRRFARRCRLNVHMARHGEAETKLMFCDHCGFGFDNKPRLVRHMLKHIRHRNTYVCDLCKYITHRKLSIEKHMMYGHGDEHDRYCRICDKSYKLHAYLIMHYYNRHGVRYKTLKNIKLETSVTIKEEPQEPQEPQEPIPDAEVDLEEIRKQEPLADIITDVALDVDATDMSYSKSVLSADIERSAGRGRTREQARASFRRTLRGPAGALEENTLYARKEKDVKKRIKKMLSRVRQRKWARLLERERVRYNRRLRLATGARADTNIKVKFVNANQTNNNKKSETDQNKEKDDSARTATKNKEDDSNTNRETKDGFEKYYEVVVENTNAIKQSYTSDSQNERDETNTLGSLSDVENGDVRNVYEDVLDIEENPVGEMNDVLLDTIVSCKKMNSSMTGNLEPISTDIDKRDSINDKINDLEKKYENVNDLDRDNSSNNEAKGKKSSMHTNDDVVSDIKKKADFKKSVSNVGSTIRNSDSLSYEAIQSSEVNKKLSYNLSLKERKSMNNDTTKENNDSGTCNSKNYKNDVNEMKNTDYRDDIINDKEGKRSKNGKLKINSHQCYVCHKLYETRRKLLDHCQEHFDVCTEVPLKKCPLCNYVTEKAITPHLKLVHNVTITLPYHKLHDKNKYTNEQSRYCYNVNDVTVKEIEIIPSVSNLNKIAYEEIDKKNRETRDLSVAKTKLVKKSGEWIVQRDKVNINEEYILPKFDEKEIKRLKHVGDSYLDVIKVMGRLAKRQNAKMLYPCNGCEKLCQTFAALKLHSRRHEANPKPFKKKVWRHKMKPSQLKSVESGKNRIVQAVSQIGQTRREQAKNRLSDATPKPIENKHKCDKKLMEFYEKNVKGADIEFWQFLKIYNRMNREHENLGQLVETNEFGDYTEMPTEAARNDVTSKNDGVTRKVIVAKNNKSRISNAKVNNKFTRKIILSKEERLRRARMKEQLRQRLNGNE